MTFDAEDSEAPNSEIVQYSWVFLDDKDEVIEQFGTAIRVTYTFSEAGDHRIGLQISSENGETARTALTVTVTA